MDDYYSIIPNSEQRVEKGEAAQSELEALHKQIEQVNKTNRELLRRLVNFELGT